MFHALLIGEQLYFDYVYCRPVKGLFYRTYSVHRTVYATIIKCSILPCHGVSSIRAIYSTFIRSFYSNAVAKISHQRIDLKL